jgi:hypothetical protein
MYENQPTLQSMKYKSLLFLILLLGVLSCKKDESFTGTTKGTLKLNIGLFLSVNEIENSLKSTNGVDNFVVTIYSSLGIEVQTFPRAADMPDEIELEPGQYYAAAHSNNDLPAAFNNPYYYGESQLFSIIPGGQETVSLNCEMANTMISIVYSDQVKANYTDYQTTVSTSAGSLLFDRNESRAAYFRPLPMNILVELTWQKEDETYSTKTLSGIIPNPQPKRHYEIHIDASSAEGSAFFEISLDSLVSDMEIVNINDDGTSVPGLISEGVLIISEIMANPTSLDDSQGEWFEIYNTSGQPVDLYQVVIRKNTTEQHIINSNIILPPNSYIVLARTAGAVISPGYVYGTSVTLNNTGAVLSLYNYGTDGSDGSLICAIDYSGTGFPEATGASICLSPTNLSYVAAVSGDSWCVSVSPFSTGDLGTPGTGNDLCE